MLTPPFIRPEHVRPLRRAEYDHSLLPGACGSSDPEYWIVDVTARSIEVYRAPTHGAYTSMTTFSLGDVAHPLAYADVAVAVAGLFPA